MIKSLQPWVILSFSIFVVSACSAQINAPSDQVIEGPFTISEEWQEFTFDQPLATEPYIQYFQLLSCNQEYKLFEVGKDPENYFILSDRFKRLSDGQVIEPEVVAVINGEAYRFAYSVSAWYTSPELNGCIAMGYDIYVPNDDSGYYLPKGAVVESIKIKANTTFELDKFYWRAGNYWKDPNGKWSDAHPSRIIDLKSLPKE